jgi:hypothetical protein
MEQNERSTRIPAQHFIPSGLCIFPGTLEQEERRPRVGARRRLRRQRGGTNNVRPMAPPFHFTRLFFPFLARRRKRKSRESKQETHNQACCRFHAVYALGFFFGVEEKESRLPGVLPVDTCYFTLPNFTKKIVRYCPWSERRPCPQPTRK